MEVEFNVEHESKDMPWKPKIATSALKDAPSAKLSETSSTEPSEISDTILILKIWNVKSAKTDAYHALTRRPDLNDIMKWP